MPGKATASVSDWTRVRSLARRKSKWTMGRCGALRRCGCAWTYERTQFLCVKFRLGSAGEPTICSHCYDVLNEDVSFSEGLLGNLLKILSNTVITQLKNNDCIMTNVSPLVGSLRPVCGFHWCPIVISVPYCLHKMVKKLLQGEIMINSLAPGRPGHDFTNIILNLVLMIGTFRSSNDVFRRISQDFTDDKSLLVQAMGQNKNQKFYCLP